LFFAITEVNTSGAFFTLVKLGIEPFTVQKLTRKRFLRGDTTRKRKKAVKTPFLDTFGVDVTKKAREGLLDPLIGRALELDRMVGILGRRGKSNPMLVGEPGVGKTVMVEGLAQRIVDSEVPQSLLGKRVVSLDLGLIVAGAKFRGDFEERLGGILKEVQLTNVNVILFIDEVHQLVGAGGADGGAMDASNIMKPPLARGGLQCIGATTVGEYGEYIEKDMALVRRFQLVKLEEPSSEEAIEIIYGVRWEYEKHHKLLVSDGAVEASVELSKRYIPGRFLPDKAIDLLDESCASVSLASFVSADVGRLKEELSALTSLRNRSLGRVDQEEMEQFEGTELLLRSQIKVCAGELLKERGASIVTEGDVARIVSLSTDIPVDSLNDNETEKLLLLEEILGGSVIGQKEAIKAVSDAVKRSRVGLKSPGRPTASLLFSGPTGVGKTELCKALSTSVFGSEDSLLRFDMSEYMSSHNVARLIGAPPGYVGYEEGGLLTGAVRARPYSLVLFDEIEKAHKSIFDVMLQILDDARLTDSKGQVVSFSETVIIITSNLGSRLIESAGDALDLLGGDSRTYYERVKDTVVGELKEHFRPEFLNRLDDVVVFRQLKRREVAKIADILVEKFKGRLRSAKAIDMEMTSAFRELLLEEGYDPDYGARPLRRAVTKLLENQFAQSILEGKLKPGDTAIVDVDEDGKVKIVPFFLG
jgi:ATP-dependent Clp protease ATP-binding subunit ClpC